MLITSALGLICPAYGSNCRISCIWVMPDLLKFWGKKSVSGFQLTQKCRACSALPLVRFAAMPARNPAMCKLTPWGCYSMKEIDWTFNIHCATVSRILKRDVEKV